MYRTNSFRRSNVVFACALVCGLANSEWTQAATTIPNGSVVQVTSNAHFSPGTVTFNTHNAGFTTVESIGGSWTVSNNIEMGGTTFGGQRFNFIGANNLTFSSTTTLLIENGIGVLGTGMLDLAGGVHGNFAFNKYGSGTLAISGATTGTGDLRILGGVLRANDGTGLPAGRNLEMSSGILETSGTFNRNQGSGVGQIEWNGTGGFSAIGGALTVDINGGGASNLGWNTSTGGRIVVLGPNFNQGGELRFNSTSSTDVVTLVDNISLGGHHGLDSGPRVINVTDNPSSTSDWAVISGRLDSGTGGNINSLQKTGAGRLDLGGNNTYTGTTTVSAGTLNINGTTSGQGGYSVVGGAMLGGNGTIGLASGQLVTVDGAIAPGTSAGKLTIGGVGNGIDINGTYRWELTTLADNSTGTPGVEFDQLAVSAGNVVIDPAATLELLFGVGMAPDDGNSFWGAARSWTILNHSGAGTSNDVFTNLVNANFARGDFALQNLSGDLLLEWSPQVPEPSTLFLAGLGVAGMMFSGRRMRALRRR